MSERRRELVERMYEAANRGDLGALERLVSPDLRWEWPSGMAEAGAVYEGHDGMRRGIELFAESWDELRMEPEEILERGDQAFVVVRYHARGRGSGIAFETPVVHLLELANGQVVRWRMFANVAKARRRFLLEHAYRRFNETHEFDWDLLDPGVEWNAFPVAPTPRFRGHDGVRRWLTDVSAMFEHLRIEPEEFIDRNDRVVVVSTMRGRGIGSGVESEQPLVSVWTFREGLVVRHDAFHDRAEALAAASV